MKRLSPSDSQKARSEAALPGRLEFADKSRRVLVADDNADMRGYVSQLLGQYWTVEAVADGVSALAAAQERTPDLVLSEVMMPGMDGIELLRRLRSDERLLNTPVILLSARAGEEARVEGMEAGADDYLIKPFSARELVARVRAHLQLARVRRETEQVLRESEGRLRTADGHLEAALRASKFVVFEQDRDLRYVWIRNPALGYRPEDVVGKTDRELFERPEDAARLMEIKRRVIQTGKPERVEVPVFSQGLVRWYDLAVQPQRQNGRINGILATAGEITERKRAEEALRVSEERFRKVFEHAPTGICITDEHGRFFLANRAYQHIVGYREEELQNVDIIASLVHPEDQEENSRQLRRLLAGEASFFEIENRYLHKDGHPVWVHKFISILPDATGGRPHILALVTDITARRHNEQNLAFLAGLDSQFAPLNTPEQIVQMAGESIKRHFQASRVNFSDINAAGDEITVFYSRREPGLKDDYITHKLLDYFSEELRNELRGGKTVAVNDVTADPRTASHAAAYVQWDIGSMMLAPHVSDGRWRLLIVVHKPGPCAWRPDEVALMQEIAARVHIRLDRARAEQALQESQTRLKLALEAANAGVWDWNIQTGEVVWSPENYELFGMQPGQVPLNIETWSSNLHPDDVSHVKRAISDTVEGLRSLFESEFRVRHPQRGERWILGFGRVERDAKGTPARMYGINIDITSRKRFQSELERMVDERTRSLQETTDQLNAFCYSIAHDLKAPLRTQVGFASLLIEEFGQRIGAEGIGYLQRVLDAANRQARLVNDLLSHMSLNRAELPLQPVNLADAVETASQDLHAEIQRTQALLEIRSLDGFVLANSASLHLVLVNLLSNALKFVARGTKPEISVWSQTRTDTKGESWLGLAVKDNGIGIPPQSQEKIFGVFERLHSNELYPGTGIGLAIVKRAVERMNGRVGVESEPGKGSLFWVELRAAESGTSPGREPTS